MAGEIVIRFEKGKVERSVQGVKGKSCDDVDKFLNGIGKIKSNTKTAEYYGNTGAALHKNENANG